MNGRTALVVGAAGGIGGEVVRTLVARGWNVRALTRRPASFQGGVTPITGDAMSREDVSRAGEGADLIVHAVNPPGYRRWGELVLPMLDNTLAAARATGARVLLPGTVYNFGPDAGAAIDETAPRNPTTRKGAVRVEMERRLADLAERGEGRVLIVRAGDYFGPRASNNWFGQAMVKAGSRPRSITNPGRPGVGHQWAYLPDVAETMVRLAERSDLEDFAVFHMDGHWDADGTEMVRSVKRCLGDETIPVRSMPWALMRLLSPFVPLFRELTEIRPLWERPSRLVNAKLLATLGAEPRTPLDEAVRASLVGLGCVEGTAGV